MGTLGVPRGPFPARPWGCSRYLPSWGGLEKGVLEVPSQLGGLWGPRDNSPEIPPLSKKSPNEGHLGYLVVPFQLRGPWGVLEVNPQKAYPPNILPQKLTPEIPPVEHLGGPRCPSPSRGTLGGPRGASSDRMDLGGPLGLLSQSPSQKAPLEPSTPSNTRGIVQ